jgi:hypothetical protein
MQNGSSWYRAASGDDVATNPFNLLGTALGAVPEVTLMQAAQAQYAQYVYLNYTTPAYGYTIANTTTNVYTAVQTNAQIWGQWNQLQQESMDREALLRARRELERAQAEQMQREDKARERAAELLLMCLSPAQRLTWDRHKMFVVRCRSGNRYKLAYSSPPMQIDEADLINFTYCIHTGGVPREDELLGFKLMLEANENLFLQIANATPMRRAA